MDQSVIVNGIMEILDFSKIQTMNTEANLMVRNTTSLLALVRADVGAMILSELSILQDTLKICLLSLEARNPRREVGIIRKLERPLP